MAIYVWATAGRGLSPAPLQDCVTDEQCELLLPYLDMEDFTQARAEKSCGSIAGLCTWVRAMVRYLWNDCV